MPRPEELSHHLKEQSKELRQKARRRRKRAKEKRKQKQKSEKRKQKQEHSRQQKINKQRKLEVNRLDSQLSIGKYIKSLRSQLQPLNRVRKWKSDEGQIAYAFPYCRRTETIRSGGHMGAKGSTTPITVSYEHWRDVLGVTLNYDGKIDIKTAACRDNYPHKQSINPLKWSSTEGATLRMLPLGTFNITSEGGLEEFTQILINFYLEQKPKG